MRRVAIIGTGGAGKTTLALELGRRLGIPVVHLDRLFWQPGWVEPPAEEWRAIHNAALGSDTWIADGNYGSTMDERFAAADTIVFVDTNPAVCLWRVGTRLARLHGRTRVDMAPGCTERFRPRETLAFWWYVARYRRIGRPSVLERLRRHADGKTVHVLKTRREVARFLASVPSGQSV